MVPNQIYKKLEDYTMEPSPMAWGRIEKNIKTTHKRSQLKLYFAVAALFLFFIGFTVIYASLHNSYEIELVENTDTHSQDYEIYNIELRNILTKAYQGNLN